MAEFQLIRRLLDALGPSARDGSYPPVVGAGDDGAVLQIPPARQLVVSTDTLVEGRHFHPGLAARQLAHKSLAVNLSDLAAMGAEPAWFFLSLSLPGYDEDWIDGFAAGLSALAESSGAVLAGGDTTEGPLVVTVTVLGLIEPGRALLRSGARAGDRIFVSGSLGDAARALQILANGQKPDLDLQRALHQPSPRLRLGRRLAGVASACIDISDGLVADLGHVLKASGVGAEIDLEKLPASSALHPLPDEDRFDLQLTGGDEYELCFTVAPEAVSAIDSLADELELPLTQVGRINDAGELILLRPDGSRYRPRSQAYEHFSGADRE